MENQNKNIAAEKSKDNVSKEVSKEMGGGNFLAADMMTFLKEIIERCNTLENPK